MGEGKQVVDSKGDPKLKRYRVRYKFRHSVLDMEVQASSQDRADVIGREWCTENTYIYLGVDEPTVIREPEWEARKARKAEAEAVAAMERAEALRKAALEAKAS